MDRAMVHQRVWELGEPLALAAGLELVDVQFRPEGGRMVLRVLLDHPGDARPGLGVTLDELARFSRELGDVLDGHDAIPGRYHLECSSPGLNRPLVRAAHFRRAVGERVSVRTREPVGDRRQFHGVLEAVEDEGIIVTDPAVGRVRIPLVAVEKAHVEYDFTRPAGTPPAHA
jgi:ribosome maturation factor RimP